MKHILLMLSLASLSLLNGCQNYNKPFPDDLPEYNKEYLPDWQEGYLDIHQISTGRGDAAFLILPDGTTMLVDAGDLGKFTGSQEIMQVKPNESKRPGEWIANYIKHFSKPLNNEGAIDYAIMTHFHDDHIGSNGSYAIDVPGVPYRLTGVTQVGHILKIKELADRAWPDYDGMTAGKDVARGDIDNYKKFVADRTSKGLETIRFEVGTDKQFPLKNDAAAYPEFKIRNIACNGYIWTGEGNNSKPVFTEETMKRLDENNSSCALLLSYGDFDWFTGGDIEGRGHSDDMETSVGALIGETEVVVANHHAYSDAMNDSFIMNTKPRAFIIPVWDWYHPQPVTLDAMLSQKLYKGEREVYAAGLVEGNRTRLGENGQKIMPSGHIVVRVYPGGNKYQIFVLNDNTTSYEIIYKTSEIISRK